MVVIREDLTSLRERFSESSIDRWDDFAGTIGYSIEKDDELKIELNPDRPDLFSFETLSAASETFYGKSDVKPVSFGKSSIKVTVDPEVRKVRKYFFTFIAKGPRIGEHFRALIDYQERIHDSIGKDRKKVSIGIHDLSKIRPPIKYTAIHRKDLTFTTYDGMTGSAAEILQNHEKGKQYAKLIKTDEVPVIVDSTGGVLSLPPVINGTMTAVSEESSSFFVDLTGNDFRALRSAFHLLTNFFSVCGFTLSIPNHTGSSDPETANMVAGEERMVPVQMQEVREILGIDVLPDKAVKALERMGIKANSSKNALDCIIPGHREDLMGPADVIEDLAKAIGYSHIPETPISIGSIGTESWKNLLSTRARELLIGEGFQEIMTYFVTSRDLYKPFSESENYTILNPKNKDFSFMRDALFPNMLHFLSVNRNRSTPQKIFEVGHVVAETGEKIKLCIMILDSRSNYSIIKQALDTFLTRSIGERAKILGSDDKPFIPGRGGVVKVNNRSIGKIGELHPRYLEQFSLRLPVSFVELDLELVFKKTEDS